MRLLKQVFVGGNIEDEERREIVDPAYDSPLRRVFNDPMVNYLVVDHGIYHHQVKWTRIGDDAKLEDVLKTLGLTLDEDQDGGRESEALER